MSRESAHNDAKSARAVAKMSLYFRINRCRDRGSLGLPRNGSDWSALQTWLPRSRARDSGGPAEKKRGNGVETSRRLMRYKFVARGMIGCSAAKGAITASLRLRDTRRNRYSRANSALPTTAFPRTRRLTPLFLRPERAKLFSSSLSRWSAPQVRIEGEGVDWWGLGGKKKEML